MIRRRELIGHEGEVPFVGWFRGRDGWGFYVRTRRWRLWLGDLWGDSVRRIERVR
jgi:hypothetical protein